MRFAGQHDEYDVVIVGGGVSGTALLYTLMRYTTLRRIALVEKHAEAGTVNSAAHNNSQTLHVGDIETNYSVEKAREVNAGSSMVARYAAALAPEERAKILFPVRKMVLAIGKTEVKTLKERFDKLKGVFPSLAALEREAIAREEPAVVEGRNPREEIFALGNDGFAVDYQMLARSFVEETRARADAPARARLFFGSSVEDVSRAEGGSWRLRLSDGGELSARVVVFDTDAYSLLFAKRLGYGKEFSLIPVAGTFFFTRKLLNGKVYRVQDPRLPFAAVHGDPDVRVPGATRWGPTARFVPVLEARNWKTAPDYFRVSGLHRFATWASFASILLEPVRFFYLARNILYEIPFLGRYFFARQVRRIAPVVSWRDVTRARGFGGMRLQRVNTDTRELLLGEGKIVGDKIIFNMSPSPGASVCLYNAMRDAKLVAPFFGGKYAFDEERMKAELCEEGAPSALPDVSLKESYAS